MFKDIQKKLLLQYPLLWNTKFVPMVTIGILMHIIFFGLGYIDGTIDFSNRNNIDIISFSIMIGILSVIIIVILWLVAYFKNNALKSFYSKSKNSLFFEWMQVFVICILLISFYIPFSIGKQLHQRNYYSLEETAKRCKTISTADMFIDGSFGNTEIDSLASGLIDSLGNKIINNQIPETYENPQYPVETVAAVSEYIYKNHIIFNEKKYDQFSILNRNTFGFSVISREQDSLNKIQVNTWLHNNNEGEIKKLMADYMSLIREHNLATNLNANKWFEITYKAPDFKEFLYIQPYLKEYETENSYQYNDYETAVAVPYGEKKYSKYFVQQDILKDKYDIVADAHTDPFIEIEMIISFLYGAFGLSILIFSFRVSSGKSWLIAVVVTGVINIIYGIFTAIFSSGTFYFYLILATILGILFYFLLIFFNKKSLQLSRIALNLVLWSFTAIIPIVYFLTLEANKPDYYYNRNFDTNVESPFYIWLNEHILEMFSLNFILSILFLFILSKIIRNWKGIAEN